MQSLGGEKGDCEKSQQGGEGNEEESVVSLSGLGDIASATVSHKYSNEGMRQSLGVGVGLPVDATKNHAKPAYTFKDMGK